jgi:hypothetical protein
VTAPASAALPGEPPPDEELADLVARRVLGCPGVDALAGGGLGQVATFLPGRRVLGVALHDDVCEVQVVLRLADRPLPEIADQVRQAVRPVVGDRRVDVLVADVVLPSEAARDEQPSDPAAGSASDRPTPRAPAPPSAAADPGSVRLKDGAVPSSVPVEPAP